MTLRSLSDEVIREIVEMFFCLSCDRVRDDVRRSRNMNPQPTSLHPPPKTATLRSNPIL